MTMLSRVSGLLLLLLLSLAAEVREVSVYGPAPVHPAITGPAARQLYVGLASLALSNADAQLMQMNGGWVRGLLEPIWKLNGQGLTIDINNVPTTDPSAFVLNRLEWVWYGIAQRTGSGTLTTHSLMPVNAQRVPFIADPSLKVGEFYRYQSGQVEVIDIVHGISFTSHGAASQFHRCDLFDQVTQTFRADQNDYDAMNRAFGLTSSPTRSFARTTISGGRFGVVVITDPREGMVFRGQDILVDGEAHPDLYRWEGVSMVVPQGLRRSDGFITWTVREPSGTSASWAASPGNRRPDAELGEPAFTQYQALLGTGNLVIEIIDQPEAATPDTVEVLAAVNLGRVGDALDQQNSQQVQSTFSEPDSEYIKTVNGQLVVTDQATYSDAGLEDLRAEMATMGSSLAVGMQGDINGAEQLAPLAQTPLDGDAIALVEAIHQVDQELISQTPTTANLTPRYRARYAEMLPAGRTDAYSAGNPVPGDGNNPQHPVPDGAQDVGQPIYDLDGDGDIDRVYTDDPYGKGYDQVVLKWHVDDALFQVKPVNQRSECNFALYVQNSANPDSTRKLFFAGFDDMLWREKQTRKGIKLGINLYSYALSTHFEAAARPNEYRFALRYTGQTQPPVAPEPPPEPVSSTVSWTKTNPITLADQSVVLVISETGTETIFTWPSDLYDESELLTATYSDPTFIPSSITGRPMSPCKFVRTVTPYTILGAGSTPGTPTTQIVYFPADFRPENIEAEPPQAIPNVDNAFMWDYRRLGDGLPYNYQRGANFGRHSRGAVIMNDPIVLARYGGEMPVQQVSTLVENGGVEFIVKEVPDVPRIYPDAVGDLAGWIARRSNVHAAFDAATDLKPGGSRINHHGERTFDIIQGVGFYIYRGQKENYTNITQQRNLLRKMWDYDLYQPRTVYTILHQDNDELKPLLNTAVAPMNTDADVLYNINNGLLKADLTTNGANVQTNALRRGELKKTVWYFFSAARGRDHEIAYALATPKETKLYCVEWDNLSSVQQRFAGYDLTFLSSDEEERKLKGEVITKIYGRTNMKARFESGGRTTGIFTETGLEALINAQPGKYVFLDPDMLYDKPACWIAKCSLLDDEQYGDPRSEQWVVNHKMQFRHPMVIYYDDRWSAVVAAYGANSDPAAWCSKWDEYSLPTIGDGSDLCKVAFEAWGTEPHLASLYDRMNRLEYDAAKVGNVVLTPRPTLVNRPIRPQEPSPWTGGELIPPQPVEVADKLRLWSAYNGPATQKSYDLNPAQLPNNPLDDYTWAWSPWSDGTPAIISTFTANGISNPGTTVPVQSGSTVTITSVSGVWAYGPGRTGNPDEPNGDPNNRMVIRWAGGSAMPTNTTVNPWVITVPAGVTSLNFQINDAGSRTDNSGTVTYRISYGYKAASAFNGMTPAEQLALWDGNVQKFDFTRTGWLRVAFPNQTHAGAPEALNIWIPGGADNLYPMGGNGVNRSAYLYGSVPSAYAPGSRFIAFNYINLNRLSDNSLVASRTNGNNGGAFTIPNGEFRATVANDWNSRGIYWFTSTGGFPSVTTYFSVAAAARPMTMNYYNLVVAGDLIARTRWYQETYEERRDGVPKIRAYNAWRIQQQEYLDRRAAYDGWLLTYADALERYNQEMAVYVTQLQGYENYLAANAAWQAMYDEYRDRIEGWQNYVRTRDAWVYLVRTRMNDASVTWSTDEPTGLAYTFWRTQTEARECPECN